MDGSAAPFFSILTAARPGQAVGATWDEIDLTEKPWVIPGEHMKKGKTHKVPLSAQALAIIAGRKIRVNNYVFPGGSSGRLGDGTLLRMLRLIRCTGSAAA